VIEGPARAALLLVRHPDLARHEEPAPGLAGVDLVARQEARMAGQEQLEIDFGGERRLGHLRELPVSVEEKDPSGHAASCGHFA